MTDPLEMAVEHLVDIIERETDMRCPEANRKNAYLKACWLLVVYQKVDSNNRYYGKPGQLDRHISEMKTALPKLRELSMRKP